MIARILIAIMAAVALGQTYPTPGPNMAAGAPPSLIRGVTGITCSSSLASITLSFPSATQVGDLGVVFSSSQYTVTPGVGSGGGGWPSFNSTGGSYIVSGSYYHTINSSDTGNVTVNYGGTAGACVALVVFRGAPGDSRWNATYALNPWTSPVTPSSLSVGSTSAVGVYWSAVGSSPSTTLTISRGTQQSTASSGYVTAALYTEPLSTIGSITPLYSYSTTAGDTYNIMQMVAE